LNEEQFQKDKNDTKILARISQDIRDGTKAGVRGSPTIFINGRLLKDLSLEGFRAMIEKELERIKKPDP
jgi:protein-disulfide isomerase